MATDKGALPAKLYYRIGEVSDLVGVEPHVLRYWEREFRSSVRPSKSARGRRVYSRRDVETLMRVRELLYSEGFTIAGARKKLLSGKAAGPTAAATPAATQIAAAAAPSLSVASTASASTAVAIAAPSAPSTAREPPGMPRAALLEMKAEIEAFLAELGA
jgi:DNA-binding transcriptional MerR regulator